MNRKKVYFILIISLAVFVAVMLGNNRKLELKTEPATIAASGGSYLLVEGNDLMMWGEELYSFWSEKDLSFDERIKIFDGASSVWGGRFRFIVLDTEGGLWTLDSFYGVPDSDALPRKNEWTRVLTHVVSASVGLYHYAAIRDDGSLWMWGENDKGQLGNGTVTSGRDVFLPQKIMDDVSSVYALSNTTIAVTSDYQMYAWGSELGPTPLAIARNVVSVNSSRDGYIQILCRDGDVYQWTSFLGAEGELIGPVATDVESIFKSSFLTEDGRYHVWDRVDTASDTPVFLSLSIPLQVKESTVGFPGQLILLEDASLVYLKTKGDTIRVFDMSGIEVPYDQLNSNKQ